MSTLAVESRLDSFLASARTQWIILKICVEERLVYRGDFALGTFMRFLPIVTQIFLWGAVFSSLPAQKTGETQQILGYSYENFIAYYLLTYISRAFSSMPGLAGGISRDIRDGSLKRFLIQPVDMITYLFWSRVAHKLVYYMVATGPLALLFFLCRGYFPAGWPPIETLAAFAASLVMAFLLGFLLESTMGMSAFWFGEVSSLVFVYMLFSFFFSGHMFPIDMLPNYPYLPLRQLVELIPLQYLAYFPSAVFLEKVQGANLVRGLLIQAGWVVALFVANRAVFHYGVKRYSAYGG